MSETTRVNYQPLHLPMCHQGGKVSDGDESRSVCSCSTSFSPILKIQFFIAQCSVLESFQGIYA